MADDKDPNSLKLESFLQNEGDLPIETSGTSESLDAANSIQINSPEQTNTASSEKGNESPINSIESSVSSKEENTTSPNINQTETNSAQQSERTTVDNAVVTTDNKPELVSPEKSGPESTSININLEKKEESNQSKPEESAGEKKMEVGPINEPNKTIGPTIENRSNENTTNQNINLVSSTSNVGPVNSATSQTVSNTTNNQEGSTSNVVNSSIEKESESPRFFKKAATLIGGALNPIGERLIETGKESLKVAGARLENMGIPINLVGNTISGIRERREEKRNKEAGSVVNTETTVSNQNLNLGNTENTTNSNSTVTQNSPNSQTETRVEKSNLVVEGKPTTANVEKPRVEPQPVENKSISPTIAEVPSPGPTPTAQMTGDQAQNQTVLLDTASLEARLKRIEMALTNPLEVIIKEV